MQSDQKRVCPIGDNGSSDFLVWSTNPSVMVVQLLSLPTILSICKNVWFWYGRDLETHCLLQA